MAAEGRGHAVLERFIVMQLQVWLRSDPENVAAFLPGPSN